MPSIILPLSFLIMIIFSLIYCKGFTINNYFSQNLLEEELANIISPYIYVFSLIIKSLITSLIYINIGLIVSRKNHKLYMSIILSYLLYIGIEIFLEGIIGKILFFNILQIDSMMLYFNIMNIYSLNLTRNYLYIFIPLIIILAITTIIVIKLYKNKEALLIDCDKNN